MTEDPKAQARKLAEELAQSFHETYERLAPFFGYETRKDSAVAWEAVPENNKRLMVAVCGEILARGWVSPEQMEARILELEAERDAAREIRDRLLLDKVIYFQECADKQLLPNDEYDSATSALLAEAEAQRRQEEGK